MENEYYGIYAVLVSLPIWATITIFYLLTLFVVDAGREHFEGFSYNVSHTARYGDIGLLVVIIIGATILQRNPELNKFLATKNFQSFCLLVFLIIIFIMLLLEGNMRVRNVTRQAVDKYHNVFILPLIIYLLIALIPVIYFHGTLVEKGVTEFFIVTWIALLCYDIKDGRLEQRSWLKKHGYLHILKN